MQAGSRLRASAGDTKGCLVHWNEIQRPRGKRSQFERRMEQKKKHTKTHQQTHFNQKSVSPQLQKLTDGLDGSGRQNEAGVWDRGTGSGIRESGLSSKSTVDELGGAVEQQHCKKVGGSKINSGVILWVGQPRQRAESKEPSQMSRIT